MSSEVQAEPRVPKTGDDNKEKRLSRVLTRVKTVFWKLGDGKRTTIKTGTATATKTGTPAVVAPADAPNTKSQPIQPVSAPKRLDTPPTYPEYPDAARVPRSQIYEERARRISERFGLQINPNKWYPTEGHALRVEKPIRMRVTRECHNCGHTFGASKECPGCQHIRCKECQRKPPRRTEAEKEESRKKRAAMVKERAENPPIIADWDFAATTRKVLLTRPSKTGGPDLVHRKPRQRVRRNCCQCQRLYVGGDKTCAGCEHVRCTDCPRDPPKKEKYPYGYPGDEYGPNSTAYFKCHECETNFPPNPARAEECIYCKHTRCDQCPRIPPRKVEPEPDPELVKRVYEKLARMNIGGDVGKVNEIK